MEDQVRMRLGRKKGNVEGTYDIQDESRNAGGGEEKQEAAAGGATREAVEGKASRKALSRRSMKTAAEVTNQERKADQAQRAVRKALRGGNQVGVIFFSLVLTGIVFFVLMDMEKRMLTDYERAYAVTVKKELQEGELLTGENVGEYLELKEFAADAVPAGAFGTLEETEGFSAAVRLERGVILTASMLEARTERIRSMEEPVVAGFRAEEISQAVCGTLRAGDVIHICVVDPEKEEPVAVWEDVLVEQVFDGSGVRIPNGDTASSAQAVNILLERAELERFYVELAKGSVRVAKER